MPMIEATEERALCPAGLHALTLTEVARKEVDDFNGEGKIEKFAWRFIADKADPETGLQYEVSIWTGTKYGNAKAKLTWLLDLLIPGITPQKAIGLDTDTLLHSRYEASIKHVAGKKDPSRKFAEAIYLRPLVDVSEVDEDPFADAMPDEEGNDWDLGVAACSWPNCSRLLTADEIAGCRKRGWPKLCTEHGKDHIKTLNAARPG